MKYMLEEKLQSKEKTTRKKNQKKPQKNKTKTTPHPKQQNPDFLTKAGSKMHKFNFLNLYFSKVHVLQSVHELASSFYLFFRALIKVTKLNLIFLGILEKKNSVPCKELLHYFDHLGGI